MLNNIFLDFNGNAHEINKFKFNQIEFFNNSFRQLDENITIDYSNNHIYTTQFSKIFINYIENNLNLYNVDGQQLIDLIIELDNHCIFYEDQHKIIFEKIINLIYHDQFTIKINSKFIPNKYFIQDFIIIRSILIDLWNIINDLIGVYISGISAIKTLKLVNWCINYSFLDNFYKEIIKHIIKILILYQLKKVDPINLLLPQQHKIENITNYIRDAKIMINILENSLNINNDLSNIAIIGLQYSLFDKEIKLKIDKYISECNISSFDKILFF